MAHTCLRPLSYGAPGLTNCSYRVVVSRNEVVATDCGALAVYVAFQCKSRGVAENEYNSIFGERDAAQRSLEETNLERCRRRNYGRVRWSWTYYIQILTDGWMRERLKLSGCVHLGPAEEKGYVW